MRRKPPQYTLLRATLATPLAEQEIGTRSASQSSTLDLHSSRTGIACITAVRSIIALVSWSIKKDETSVTSFVQCSSTVD